MPKIPVYESQVSAGGVPATPQATADDFGATTSKAIVGATQAGLDFAGTVIEARHAAETSRGTADATRDFDAIKQMGLDDDDPATLPDRLKQRLGATEAKYRAMGAGAYRDAALGLFKSFGPTFLATARNNAAKREIALHQNDLTTDSDYFIGQAAAASNDLERQIYVNLTKTAIARANEAGYITRDDALERLRALPGRIEEKQVEALIERDPSAALAALDDPKQFRNLDPATHELQRGRAMLGRQKASFATVSAVQQGIADGTKTPDDVDALLKDGAIGAATHDWLYEQADKAEKERAEKADGQKRVQSILDEGGRLDPKKPKDQTAVDAHYDAVVAPANPSAATLVGYVRRTGMVPTGLGRRIRGGLASDDPQQVVNAASLIQELGKSDGKLVAGFGAKRTRYAKAVMDGIEGGLSSERAVELATKRFGQPDPSDDDGTQVADAEGGSAADEGKKDPADENSGSANAQKTHSSEAKDGGASDAKNDSAKADAATAKTTGETVGPEIAPVGDTGDGGQGAKTERKGYSGGGHGGGGGGGDANHGPRTEKAQLRIAKDIAHATSPETLRKHFESEYGSDVYSRTGAPPPPPGMDVASTARAGNWIGKGFGGGRTNPSFLPLTTEDEAVGPANDMYGKLNWFDKISKPHDKGFNVAQQTLLRDLLDFDKSARQVFGDYFSTLARTDREFLLDAQEGIRDLDTFDRTGDERDLGVMSKDPYLRDLFRVAVNVFEGTAWNYERLARLSYQALNLHEQTDSPALADAKLRLQMFSALVDGDVVGRPVEAVLNNLRNRVSELGGNPDEVMRGRPAAYVDNPEQKNEPSYVDPNVAYETLDNRY
jgi:hypothetical protein